ncbi:MAG TPA: carbohydrate-binding protein [Rhodocyclaceae bacterium]|nr:carbohydrate-binding protein [Rhodocyclaceae bacterium]
MYKRILEICFLITGLIAGGSFSALAQGLSISPVPPASMFCDYENVASCSQGNTGLQCRASGRATNVTTSRTNGYAIALTTLSGDTNIAGSGSWERCDLSFGLQSSEGTDEWWWSSVYLPDAFHMPSGSDQCYVLGPEFHSVYSGDTQPNLQMQLCPPPYGWMARIYGGAGTPQTDGPGRHNFTLTDPYGGVPATKNKWYDILMHTKWSYTSAGVTQVWINGTQVINYSGPNLYQNYNVYLKLPNYHGPYGVASTLYYDRTVRGPTQASVTPSTSTASTTTGATTGTTTTTTTTTTTSPAPTTGTTSGTTPSTYAAAPITIPGVFMAANFDAGGKNVAYYDTTPGNLGGQYRLNEDVDIIASCDPNAVSPYVVNNFATGEWMKYTVNVATAGSYAFSLLASNSYSGNPAFHLEVDGVKVGGSIPVPSTGAWCTFKWVPTPAVMLSAGTHVVKVFADQQFFNLESISATAAPAPAPYISTYKGKPYTGTPIAVPGKFTAANFDLGGQNVAYYDKTSTNIGGQYRPNDAVDIIASCDATPTAPYVLNNFSTGEWLNYTINVATAGNYIVQLRTSNNYSSNVALHVEVDGVKVAGPVMVPVTSSWCTFKSAATTAFPLAAGTHVLKIMSDQQYFNLESVNVISSP